MRQPKRPLGAAGVRESAAVLYGDTIMDAGGDAGEDIARIAGLRGAPGVLVLSAGSKVLFINQRGWDLIHDFNDAKVVKASGGVLPAVVDEVCQHLQAIAREQFHAKDFAPVEVRRMADATPRPILVRGLLLPGAGGSSRSRVLILLEAIGREEKTALSLKERFGFTDREEMVVQNLAKGWTNKEIASELNIAEQTVKVYIKQIMDKTRCTTRTGIVAQVLSP